MKSSYTQVGIGRLCMLFGKTRHAFYDKSWHETERMEAKYVVLEMVSTIRRELPRIGTPKLYHMISKPLKRQGIKMGRDALHNLLADHGLTIRPKKRYVKTTNSNHWMKRYPNLIRDIVITESEQLWVSDITYLIIADDFNFLSLITDAYSKQIVGHCLYPTLEAIGSLTALKIALAQRTKPNNKLIHHSDRGVQYCCSDYVTLLKQSNIAISMTEKGDPYENAIAERVNGILKCEFGLNRVFSDRGIALHTVDKSINAYNHLRPHMSCNYLTPVEAHQMSGTLEKKWKPKIYKKQIKDLV
jgi:putative transposase